MKYIWQHQSEIEQAINTHDSIALFVDFDGTLVPIAQTPQQVTVPKETKDVLIEISRHPLIHTAVISGRSVSDLKSKIDIPALIYGGNHGLEWQIKEKYVATTLTKKTTAAFEQVRQQVKELQVEFPGVFVEDKKITLGVHYRTVSREKLPSLRQKIRILLAPYIKTDALSVIESRKVFDICPNDRFTKGHISQFFLATIRQQSQGNPLPIYIGDDTTDEDAFIQLTDAITIRVEEQSSSKARYYLADPNDVIRFLRWLLTQKSP